MYDYPVALLLLAALALLGRFAWWPRAIYSIGFFGCLLALLLVRNMFHLVVIVIAAAAGWLLYPKGRRAVIAGAIPALALGAGLYLKNWMLFGAFTGSTWLGMQLGVTTTFQLTETQADRLIAQGRLSPIARITPFSGLDSYRQFITPVGCRGIPVLDDPVAADHANFNDLEYLQIHQQYTKAALAVLRYAPGTYLHALAIAAFTYFLPPANVYSFDDARARIARLERIYSALVFGQFRQVGSRKELRDMYARGGRIELALYTGIFAMIMIRVLTLWGLAQLVFSKFRRYWIPDELAMLSFILFIVLLVALSSNLLSSFENNRYRFPIDSFYLILLVLFARTVLARPSTSSSSFSS